MKVLLDRCVWSKAVAAIAAAGHEVIWSGIVETDPDDEAMLAEAHASNRVVVTLDKDFGELAVLRRQPHCGIIRLVNQSALTHGPTVVSVLEQYGSELATGAIVTVEPGRTRIRAPSQSM